MLLVCGRVGHRRAPSPKGVQTQSRRRTRQVQSVRAAPGPCACHRVLEHQRSPPGILPTHDAVVTYGLLSCSPDAHALARILGLLLITLNCFVGHLTAASMYACPVVFMSSAHDIQAATMPCHGLWTAQVVKFPFIWRELLSERQLRAYAAKVIVAHVRHDIARLVVSASPQPHPAVGQRSSSHAPSP